MTSYYNISKSKFFCKLKKTDFSNLFLNLTLILLSVAIFLLIFNPSRYIKSINSGISLFYYSVFPSLLPFLFLSKILDGLGAFKKLNKLTTPIVHKLYNCPAIASYPFLMTLISGYPIGAKIVGDLAHENLISPEEARKIITISSTSGPIFVIGSVGANMLNNTKLGALIFISHILGCLFTALIFTRKKKNNLPNTILSPKKSKEMLLSSATTSTVNSILCVAVYVSIFYMFIDMALDIGILTTLSSSLGKIFSFVGINPAISCGISSGLIEITRGCKEIISLGNDFYSLVCCSGLISFGGISIIIQSLTLLSGSGIKAGYFFLLKLTQAILTSLIAIGIGFIFL